MKKVRLIGWLKKYDKTLEQQLKKLENHKKMYTQ